MSAACRLQFIVDRFGDSWLPFFLGDTTMANQPSQAVPRSVQGVILDVDGTLVDSNDAHAHAWVEAFREQGRDVAFEEVRPLIGMGGDKLIPRVAHISADSPEGKRISHRRGEIFRTNYLPKLRPCPGANALLRHMHARGLRLAVASSARQDELDELLNVCGAKEWITAQTSSDDAEHSKPDPDIVQAALARIGFAPKEVVMLGDTPYDIASARQAHVPVIALRTGGWQDADLAGAVAIYDSPADLFTHYDSSALA